MGYNALLGRKQFVVEVTQKTDRRGTIPKKDIQQKIAEMYKVKDENCVSGFGLIYDSVTQAKKIEPKHRLLRLGLIEKKDSNRKQLKERKNRQKKSRGMAKHGAKKKKKD